MQSQNPLKKVLAQAHQKIEGFKVDFKMARNVTTLLSPHLYFITTLKVLLLQVGEIKFLCFHNHRSQNKQTLEVRALMLTTILLMYQCSK